MAADDRAQEWALLVRPSANRVYDGAAPALLRAELTVLAAEVLEGVLHDVRTTELAGLPYVRFTGSADDPEALAHLARLSSGYALFRLDGPAEDRALHPVPVPDPGVLDEDLLTIQKYGGKTNEAFTAMLLNLTLWASASGRASVSGGLTVLDPMCGRGTTLNRALWLGHHALGVEIDGKDVEAYDGFLRTWLRRKRLKHEVERVPLRRDGRVLGRRLEVALAADRQRWKSGERLRLRVLEADTVATGDLLARNAADVVVTDAPYGVRHGSHARGPGGGRDRSPLRLLEAALPGWLRVLRPGGAVGLAWNVRVAPRADAIAVLAAAGLEPLDRGPWRELEHRVDASVQRDVLVARLPEER